MTAPAHKTKKIHNNEQVIQLQIDIKCNKSTNIARVFTNLVRQINADWECIVMNDTAKFVDKTKPYKDAQEAEAAPK